MCTTRRVYALVVLLEPNDARMFVFILMSYDHLSVNHGMSSYVSVHGVEEAYYMYQKRVYTWDHFDYIMYM